MRIQTKLRVAAGVGLVLLAALVVTAARWVTSPSGPRFLQMVLSAAAMFPFMATASQLLAEREAGYLRCPNCGGYLRRVRTSRARPATAACEACDTQYAVERRQP